MKNLFLLFSFMGISFFSFAQEGGTFIDTDYGFFEFDILQYYQHDQKLNRAQLQTLMDLNSDTKAYMDLALKRRKVALPLVILGSAGILTALFIEDLSTQTTVLLSALGVGVVGSFYIAGFHHNRQKAVNLYNKNLVQSQNSGIKLDFQVNPLASGLVLRF